METAPSAGSQGQEVETEDVVNKKDKEDDIDMEGDNLSNDEDAAHTNPSSDDEVINVKQNKKLQEASSKDDSKIQS